MVTTLKTLALAVALLIAALASPSFALTVDPQVAGASQTQQDQAIRDQTPYVLTVRSHRGHRTYGRAYRNNQFGRGFDYQYQRN